MGLIEIALIAASALAFLAAALDVSDIFDMFAGKTMFLYVVGVALVAPVVFNPVTFIGITVAIAFRILGGFAYVFGAFALIPYIIGACYVVAAQGWMSEHAPAALFWLPVYFGAPALVGISASRADG